jgi:HAD superfamily hydrolase (TIGR01509 family)
MLDPDGGVRFAGRGEHVDHGAADSHLSGLVRAVVEGVAQPLQPGAQRVRVERRARFQRDAGVRRARQALRRGLGGHDEQAGARRRSPPAAPPPPCARPSRARRRDAVVGQAVPGGEEQRFHLRPRERGGGGVQAGGAGFAAGDEDEAGGSCRRGLFEEAGGEQGFGFGLHGRATTRHARERCTAPQARSFFGGPQPARISRSRLDPPCRLLQCGEARGRRDRPPVDDVRNRTQLGTDAPCAAVEAVVLDMDGTLLDTEGAYRAAFLAAAAALGRTVDEAFYATLIGISSRERGPMVSARYGPDFPWAECLREYRARKARLLDGGVRAKPGAAELLAELAALGLPRAVATSATRRTALLALDRAGLLGAVTALVARDDVADGKPHPAPFLRAAKVLGVSPSCCLAVEDSPPGVLAARAAGMRVVMVPDALPPTPELREAVVAVAADLWEVRALLRRGLRDREWDAA